MELPSLFLHSCICERFIYSQNQSQIHECGNWETEHYKSVFGNNKAPHIHFWEYINRNQTIILDSHRPFICSVQQMPLSNEPFSFHALQNLFVFNKKWTSVLLIYLKISIPQLAEINCWQCVQTHRCPNWNNKTRQERGGKGKVHASARTEAFLSSTFKVSSEIMCFKWSKDWVK